MTESEIYLKSLAQFNGADSLYYPVSKVAKAVAHNTALRFMGANISYKKLDERVCEYASALRKIGLVKGEAVTFALPNIPESVYILYGASKGGFICSPLHPLSAPQAVKSAAEKTGSRIIFALPQEAAAIADACENALVVAVSPVNSKKLLNKLYLIKNRMPKKRRNLVYLADFLAAKVKLAAEAKPPLTESGTAALLQSGGTTGEPKIIELSYDAINNLAAKGLDILGADKVTDCGMLSVLPVFHGFGLAMGVHAMLCNGGKNVLLPKFKRIAAIKELKKGNANFIIGVPRVYEALLSHGKFCGKAVKNIITAFVGGDFVPQTLLNKFNAHVSGCGGSGKLYEGYGLTETVTVCAVNTNAANRADTVGKPIKGVKIAAFNTAGEPRPLPCGEKGELCVSGDTLMSGYLNDCGATAAVFFYYENEKYVKTGDCGYCDGDGFVHFASRYKRIIKVRGIPVYPKEIEQLCITADGVTGACVLPNPDKPDSLILFIEGSDENLITALPLLIQNKISPFAKPDRVILTKKFPLTNVSKIDQRELLKLL